MRINLKKLQLFLPQIAAFQIEQMEIFGESKDLIVIEPLTQDLQSLFCQVIGFPSSDLPWTKLRLAQFKIDQAVKTACCCDPVMLQLTHRGAYMMGQNQLRLSPNDAIRIIAQINERLMREGENLYLLDKHSWLFTSEKEISLSSPPIQDLIGKDMFNFSYAGNDASYWQQLATEIQMLIKQMVDYQGLDQLSEETTPAETIMNVHFFDNVLLEKTQAISFIKNNSLTVVSDNDLIKTFCANSFLTHKNYQQLKSVATESCIVAAFHSEKESYPEIILHWLELGLSGQLKQCQIICQDAVLNFKPGPGFWRRLLGNNTYMKTT